MTGQTAFETDSAVIKPGFQSTMDKLADAVIRYGKTSLTVTGYTDSRGTPLHNQELSQPLRESSSGKFAISRRPEDG